MFLLLGAGKKRPAWDLKGRLQDMEAILGQREADSHSLQSQLESYNQRIEQLESQKQQLYGDVAKRSEQAEMVSQINRDLQQQLRWGKDFMLMCFLLICSFSSPFKFCHIFFLGKSVCECACKCAGGCLHVHVTFH